MSRLQILTAVGLILGTGLSLYNLAHPALFAPQGERRAAVGPEVSAARVEVDLRPIIDLQPFGPVEAPAGAQTTEHASVATVRLEGIIMGRSDRESVAFLSVGDGRSLPYAAGDEVAPGIKVERVDPEAVTIRVGTMERRIALPAYAQPSGGTAAPPPARAALPDAPGAPTASPQPLDPRNQGAKSDVMTLGDTEFVENLVTPALDGVYLVLPSLP